MIPITLLLALGFPTQNAPAIDARTVFALLERYHASFQDIAFVHEGTWVKAGGSAANPPFAYRFQGFYAYRADGATVLDVFGTRRGDEPETRTIYSVLKGRLEILGASPDLLPRVRDRTPAVASGGPGSLTYLDSPERTFLAWYFPTLTDPAEHDAEVQGWEDVDGHRCLKVRMLKQPKPLLKGWPGGLPFVKFWIDLERGGYPLRYELYRGDELEVRAEITRLERLDLPDGRPLWLPAEGKTYTHLEGSSRTGVVHTKEPLSVETHKILMNTVRFNQGLNDGFFSTKKHALVANDEGLRKLQRELDQKPVPRVKRSTSDPESVQKALDEALAEADHQAERLEASSAARAGAGWFDVLTGGLGVFGAFLLGGVGSRYWRSR
jgi:hypothetical protein